MNDWIQFGLALFLMAIYAGLGFFLTIKTWDILNRRLPNLGDEVFIIGITIGFMLVPGTIAILVGFVVG